MPLLTDLYSAIAEVSVPFAPPAASRLGGLSDLQLLDEQRTVAEIRRRAEATAAALANEIAHRSRRELGHSGLAQRLGERTAEGLVQKLTGGSAPEARALVAAGRMLPVDVPRDGVPAGPLWLVGVGEAVAAGRMSALAAEAIERGLGAESPSVSAGDLAGAASALLREATTSGLTVEQLGERARALRADLDLAGVQEREEALRAKRYLKITKRSDGMTSIHGLLDPASAAVVVPVLDQLTSPRRGGPRFVESGDAERAERLQRDERTNEQLTLDGCVELIRLGAAVDDGTIVGSRKPSVHLLVTQRDLAARSGMAFFAGQTEPVSITTAGSHVCAGGMLPILFDDDGQPLRLGRSQRLFTEKQRVAMAARDGGCVWGDCTAPPSWTEAHHIDEWLRDHGETDVEDGVCLCRFHHLLLHNLGYRIIRRKGDYFLIPPPTVDADQRPIPLHSKSRALQRLLAAN